MQEPRSKSSSLLLDLSFTGVTQVLGFVSNLVLVSLFARLLGATAVAEYLLLRRVVNWVQSALQCGLFVAVPRFVAYAENAEPGKQEEYFTAGAACLMTFTLSAAAVLLLWRSSFSRLLFGSSELVYLMLPLTLMMLSWIAHNVVYSYFRGCLRLNTANTLQIWNMCAVPIIVILLLLRSRSVAVIVDWASILMIVTAALVSMPAIVRALRFKHSNFRHSAAELLRYGVARVPGDFAAGAVFALGPMIAARFMPLRAVSPLLLGTSLLMAASISVGPLGTLLLAKVSVMAAQHRLDELQKPLAFMLEGVLELSIFAALQCLVFVDVILRVWIGSTFSGAAPIVRIVLLSIPFFLFFSAARSVVDAVTIKASNAHNILISAAAFSAMAGISVTLIPKNVLLLSLAVSLTLSQVVLYALTSATLKRLCAVRLSRPSILRAVSVALVLFACSIAGRRIVSIGPSAFYCVLLELAVVLVYFCWLILMKPPWLAFFWDTYLKRRPGLYVGGPVERIDHQ
jgi:O-antigen/teichoic acid export membrane protein